MIQHFHRMISAALGISEKQIVQTLGLLNDRYYRPLQSVSYCVDGRRVAVSAGDEFCLQL